MFAFKQGLSAFYKGLLGVFYLYKDGFCNLTLGKTLWKIIFIKLFVMFVVLKMFVFDVNFKSLYTSDEAKSAFVLENLTKNKE